MEWSKVKNIIIVILLLFNGFLLVLVGARRSEAQQYEQKALAQAIQVLEENDIEASAERLVSAERLFPQSAQRSVQDEERLAQALLGEEAAGENRGGGLYTYQGSRGEVSFRAGGELSARLAEDGRWQTDDLEDHAAGLLREMGLKAELLEADGDGDTGTVVFRQTLDGAPLFSSRIVFSYREGRLTDISGTLLAAAEAAAEEGETLPLPTALLRFLDHVTASGDVCSVILSMEPGYRSAQSFSGTVYLTPVWLVTTNTADYYLNAVTGELTRAAEDQ